MTTIRRRRAALGASSLLLAAVAGGCALEQQQVEQDLASSRRVDCRTAEGDLRILQSEKATVLQQMAEGVTAIAPAGIVLGILTGTESTKLQVATGDYNQMIDARIAEIRRRCGL